MLRLFFSILLTFTYLPYTTNNLMSLSQKTEKCKQNSERAGFRHEIGDGHEPDSVEKMDVCEATIDPVPVSVHHGSEG
jgi:hypothetical protein